MTWRNEKERIHAFQPDHIESNQTSVVQDGPYTLTLVAVDNVMGALADFNSTLEVKVNDIDNGTNVTCAVFQNEDHALIFTASKCCI